MSERPLGTIQWVFPAKRAGADPIVAEERCPTGHLIASYRRSEWAGSMAASRAAGGLQRLYACCPDPESER